MKKVYFLLEDSRAILGYAEQYIPGSIEKELDDDSELLNPNIFNHYFINEQNEFIKMTDTEFAKYRPYFNKPVLSETQKAQARIDVLEQQNEELENCIVDICNVIYQ